jgi:hypothetical protein
VWQHVAITTILMKPFYVYGVSILVIDPMDSVVLGTINVKKFAREVIYIIFVFSLNKRIVVCSKAWIVASAGGLSPCITKITLVIHNQPMCSWFVPFSFDAGHTMLW